MTYLRIANCELKIPSAIACSSWRTSYNAPTHPLPEHPICNVQCAIRRRRRAAALQEWRLLQLEVYRDGCLDLNRFAFLGSRRLELPLLDGLDRCRRQPGIR